MQDKATRLSSTPEQSITAAGVHAHLTLRSKIIKRNYLQAGRYFENTHLFTSPPNEQIYCFFCAANFAFFREPKVENLNNTLIINNK